MPQESVIAASTWSVGRLEVGLHAFYAQIYGNGLLNDSATLTRDPKLCFPFVRWFGRPKDNLNVQKNEKNLFLGLKCRSLYPLCDQFVP
jgi:hypothetical protein